MDAGQPGQIIVRFGAIQPGQEHIVAEVLRDVQDYATNLQHDGVIGSFQMSNYLTEPGGQIVLSGRLQPLLNLGLDDRYQNWLVRLRLVFADFSVATAAGGGNGSTADWLDNFERVQTTMLHDYAGAGGGTRGNNQRS